MILLLRPLLVAGAVLVPLIAAQADPQLTGTWTTKSRKVVTGPVRSIHASLRLAIARDEESIGNGFYDPINEKMFEPSLTGFSYSFTDDGHYEEAYYRAVSNPTDPACPQGIIQWQHGTYTKNANGSLSLTPIGVDGRQLLSDPCNYQNAIYSRYNQFELFKDYRVETDAYSKAQRLNLFAFDGAPLNPLYLVYKPPQMLPTETLNPTKSAAAAGATSTSKAKRSLDDLEGFDEPMNKNVLIKRREPINADRWWWIGVGMTALGGVGYYCL